VIPATPANLTADALTRMLQEGGGLGRVEVESLDVESIGRGTGLLCQLARLTLSYASASAPGPRTMIVKLASDDADTRGMVALFRFHEREIRFYEELAAQVPVPTPRCFGASFDPDAGTFALLLEDLGHLRAADQLAPGSGDDARRVADALASLHARWWNDDSLDRYAWLIPADHEVNKRGLGLYAQAWPSFVERLGDRIPAAARDVGQRLGAHVISLLDELARSPRTVCHGDVRLDNMFFGPGDAAPTFIDWQIAGRGVGTFDLAYFMSQSLDPGVRRPCERDVLARYHAGLLARGVRGYDVTQCLTDYRRSLLFCFVYPVIGGGLGDVANERGHTLARVMAERSATAILDWNAADLLPS
jgi:aminoglycoside phosphotransferase (APT) family kinase protein